MCTGCAHDPNTQVQKLMQTANVYFSHGQFPEALLIYGRALQSNPNLAAAHYGSAQCYLQLGNWSAAFHELQKTIELEPENWRARLDLGKLYLAGGKAPEAKDQARLILKSNPNDLGAKILLSDADAQMGNLGDALQEAADAVALSPNDPAVYLNLASIQQNAGAFRDAETNLLKAQSLSPNSRAPLMALAVLYQSEKRWKDAEKALRAAISIAPKDPIPRAALASMYVEQGQGTLAEGLVRETKEQLSADPIAYRMLAEYYGTQGDSTKALAEFASLIKTHPQDLKTRKSYIQLLILSRRMDEASRLTDEILRRAPQDEEGLILKGQILLKAGKTEEAIQALQQAVKGNPVNANGHYQLGIAYRAKGDSHQAEGEWRAAVRMRPDLTDAWIAIGQAEADRRDWSDLQITGVQLMRIARTNPRGYLLHATARINQGDAAGAEADLKQLIQNAPQNPLGYAKLGQLRASSKRWHEAEALYRDALNRSPNSLEAIQGIVDLDFQRGKPDDAIRFIQEKINADSTDAALYLVQGHAFARAKQLQDAKKSFFRCIELDKQNLTAFAMLAQVEQILGDLPAAIGHYRQAIAIAPHNAGLYTTLGTLHESQGNWQEAQGLYQRALAIQPEEALAANNLAYIMLEHGGNVTVALTLAQTARRGFPNFPHSADTLGWAYYHNTAYSLAAPLLEDAVKAAPSNATYRYHLGMTYQKLHDLTRARIELEKSVRIDPQAPAAEKASRALSELAGG